MNETKQQAVGAPLERQVRRLAADFARCQGYSADGEWREGCDDCLRRTSPPVDPERVWMIAPHALWYLSARRGLHHEGMARACGNTGLGLLGRLAKGLTEPPIRLMPG